MAIYWPCLMFLSAKALCFLKFLNVIVGVVNLEESRIMWEIGLGIRLWELS